MAQVGALHWKSRWRGFVVAVLIIATLLIGGVIMSMPSWHLFHFGQSPSGNVVLATVTNSHTSPPATTIAPHNSVGKIADAAGVLDQNQVRSAGVSLQYPIDIYTTRNFSGTSSDLEQRARSRLTNANMIVMAISTNPSYITVVAGSGVPLSSTEAESIVSSFKTAYQSSGGNFTSATVSALQSLQRALATSSAG
ncbi:MAG TPA: hypothetical protein VN207_13210 [Ktedonobacteraceae bacterium]|nr:hypothetical protein [Ktedonobacteraceae bacterium]